MSWSGPVPHVASYPPSPFANGHVKKKGNPIITRYPPPPGYRAPAQTLGGFSTQSHPGQFPPVFSGPSTTSHSAAYNPSAFSQPAYSQSPTSYWQQQSPSHQRHPQTYPPTAPFVGSSIYHAAAAPVGYAQYSYSQPLASPLNPTSTSHFTHHARFSHGGPTLSEPRAAEPKHAPYPPQPSLHLATPATDCNVTEETQLFLGWDDWDFDFDGAIWPKSNEPVDPNLSLGVIIWHPAKQVTRALPATFAEAEDQALMPTPENLGNGESVSIYFTAENSHEAFLDVRQTDDWEIIRNDPIFVVFSDSKTTHNLASPSDCTAQRSRLCLSSVRKAHDSDEEMPDATYSVMDHLERVLSCTDQSPALGGNRPDASRCGPLSQEDILLALGVTGTPKPPSPSAFASAHTISHFHRDESQKIDDMYQLVERDIMDRSSSAQTSSLVSGNRDLADIELDSFRLSGTTGRPIFNPPTFQRSYSSSYRKRSFADAETQDSQVIEQDDYTKRKRRSQVDTVYSRR